MQKGSFQQLLWEGFKNWKIANDINNSVYENVSKWCYLFALFSPKHTFFHIWTNLEPSVWLLTRYYHKFQVMPHQDLKDPNFYLNINLSLRLIVNCYKLPINRNISLTLELG